MTGRRTFLGDDPYVLSMARRFDLSMEEARRRMKIKRIKGAKRSAEGRRKRRG